jgi:hypothetical protein
MLNIELIDRLFYELMYAVETATTVSMEFSPRPLMDTRLLGYDGGWRGRWLGVAAQQNGLLTGLL